MPEYCLYEAVNFICCYERMLRHFHSAQGVFLARRVENKEGTFPYADCHLSLYMKQIIIYAYNHVVVANM